MTPDQARALARETLKHVGCRLCDDDYHHPCDPPPRCQRCKALEQIADALDDLAGQVETLNVRCAELLNEKGVA